MGYYLALAAAVVCAALVGWWANDWWRDIKDQEVDE